MRNIYLLLTVILNCTILNAQYDVNNINEVPFQSTGKPSDLHAADFNNDGHMDVLLDGGLDLNQSDHIEFNKKPIFFLGDGNGNLTPANTTFEHPGNSSFICATADYNNDGFEDLLVADFWGNGMRLYNGGANLNYSLAQTLPTGTHGAKGKFIDFDDDGDLDIINISSGSSAIVSLHIFENTNSVFTKSSYQTNASPHFYNQPDRGFVPKFYILDLNNDGKLDVIGVSEFERRLDTWIQQPDKSFVAGADELPIGMHDSFNNRYAYWLRDMNNDGDKDLLFFNASTSVNINVAYAEQQPFYFGTNVDMESPETENFWGFFLQEYITGDVDNDGEDDVITYNRYPNFENITIIKDPFNLNGNFGQLVLNLGDTPIDKYGHGLLLVDLNNDNDLELVSLGLDDVLRVFSNNTVLDTENATVSNFSVFPNPTQSVLNIDFNIINQNEIKSIKIFNNIGQLVKDIPKTDISDKISVSSLASGTYIISIEAKNKKKYDKLFIVK